MSTAIARSNAPTVEGIEQVLIEGNLARLSSEQRVSYYQRVCESVGLNPLTQPFEYLTLQGKMILYARRACTDQLRQIHSISVTVVSREKLDGVYVVTARATSPDGRTDESIGAVPVEGLKGENYANALMKAETKAKRRVTLAICGLSMMDELEVESVPNAPRAGKPRRTLDDVAQPRESHALASGMSDHAVDAARHEDEQHGEMRTDAGYTLAQHVEALGECRREDLTFWVSALMELNPTDDEKASAWQQFKLRCAALEVDPKQFARKP